MIKNKTELRKTELAILLHNNCTEEELEIIVNLIKSGVNLKKLKRVPEMVKAINSVVDLEKQCVPPKPVKGCSDEYIESYEKIKKSFEELKSYVKTN